MQIETIRRAKLRLWFTGRSIPPKEKSYISQLLKEGNAFGERTARRLENDYGMGEGYLDTPEHDEQDPRPAPESQQHAPQPAGAQDSLLQAIRLLELFHSADDRGRADMLRLAETLCGANHYHIGSNKG